MKWILPVTLRSLGCILAMMSMALQAASPDGFPPNEQIPPGWTTPLVVTIPTVEGLKQVPVTAGWIVTSDDSNGNPASLKSSPMPDDPNAVVRKTAAIQVGGTFSAGTVSFAYRVSTEVDFDSLFFAIDGVPQAFEASGDFPWTTVSFPVSAGQHVFTWIYAKDESKAVFLDAAWIDTVTLPPGTIQQYLGVGRAGSGTGTVTSNPAGISCGGICSAYYNTNTSVTLTAAAGVGSVFSGWTGSCSGTSTTCTVSLAAARTATATFTLADDSFPPNGQLPPGWTNAPGSSANWQVVANSGSNPSHAGPFSLRSGFTGTAGDAQVSAIQFTASVVAGNIAFSYRVSSEKDYDFFAFYIDDFLHLSNSGEVPWTHVSVPVTAGSHTVRFEFRKDDTLAGGSNAAWIDSVVMPGTLNRLLSITSAGNGTGTIASTPAGISCPSTCSANYADGTNVNLTATATGGSLFAGWTGACTGTGSCVVNMNAAKDVTATFTRPVLTVTNAGGGTVTSTPTRINCGTTCSETFDHGSSVTLTAAAAAGNQFTGWSGACTGSSTTCSLSMTTARSVTATFAPIVNTTHSLTVTNAGGGTVTSNPGGINCAPTCSFSFENGTAVTLTAAAAAGNQFTGWSGACTGSSTTCALSMTASRAATATFAPIVNPTHLLTVTTAGASGTVSSTPAGIDNCNGTCSAPFAANTTVTLTASPLSGNSFTGWSGACTGSGVTCQVGMTAARSVTATFAPPASTTYVLTVTTSGSGTVTSTPAGITNCSGPCSAPFSGNTTVTLTASPANGNAFTGWTGACTHASLTCQVLMDAARSVGASFALPTPSGALDVDASNPGTKYDARTDATLVMRYLFGLTGSALTNGAIGSTATRTDPAALKTYLDGVRNSLDVDGNGTVDALTDGVLIFRYLSGLRGSALITQAIGQGATRNTATAIENYIRTLAP